MALSQHRYSAPRYTPSMMSSGVLEGQRETARPASFAFFHHGARSTIHVAPDPLDSHSLRHLDGLITNRLAENHEHVSVRMKFSHHIQGISAAGREQISGMLRLLGHDRLVEFVAILAKAILRIT